MRVKNLWRKCVFTLIALFFAFSSLSQSNASSEQVTQIVKDAFGRFMGNDPTVIGDLTISDGASGGKEFSGPVSMFGKGDLKLTGTLTADHKPSQFKIEFPASAVINLNNLDAIAGGNLKDYIPAGFPHEAGIAISYLHIHFANDGYTPSKIASAFSNSRPFGLMGDGILVVDKTELEFIIDDPKGPQRKITGILKSLMKLGGVATSLEAALSNKKEDIQFKGSINNLTLNNLLTGVGATSIANSIPATISSLGLNSLNFTIKPFQKLFSVLANSSLGEVELQMSAGKNSGGKMQFLIGIAPPSTFNFASISSSLSLLDGIKLSGTALIISGYDGEIESSLQSLKSRTGKLPALVTGLNIFTHINLGNELGNLLGKPDLDLYGSLDKSLNCNLAAALSFDNLKLAEGLYFKEVKFGIGFRPSGGKVNFNLSGRIDALIKGDLLSFNAGFDFAPTDVQLSAFFYMEALKKANAQAIAAKRNANNEIEPPEWNEPFGLKGVGLRKLGFSLGVSPKSPIFLSSLGLTADVRLGINPDFSKNVRGAFAANLDIANPFNSMLDIQLQNLTIIGMIDAFQPNAKISGTLRNWLDWGLENAYLKVVPESKTYLPDNKFYDRGIMAGGTLKLGGLSATAELKISETSFGFKAMIDPIDFSSGGFTWFALKGFEQGNKAQVNLQLNSSDPEMIIDGSITVLGITSQTSINVNSKGAKFKVQGSTANGALSASLEVVAQQLSASGGFRVKAEFTNKLQDEVVRQLIDFIKKESAKSQAAYTNAQNSLQQAKNASNNAAEKGAIDVANGFMSAFKEMDKGLSVAGQYVVKGLIGDAINIRRIYFETNLNINQFSVVASIDMTIAGKKIIQTATIDLNISSATAMAEKIVSQIKDVVISAFEDLGSDIEKGWNDFVKGADKFFDDTKVVFEDAGKWIEKAGLDFAKGLEQAATEVYKFFDNVINCPDVPAPDFGTIPAGIPPSTITRYKVTINSIYVNNGPVTSGIEATFQTEDKTSLDIFGSIAVIPSGTMWTNNGSNRYAYNVKCGDARAIKVGSSWNINHTKYFYVKDQDAASAYAYIYFGLDERDFGANPNDAFNRTSVTIRLADIAPGTSSGRKSIELLERGVSASIAQKVTVYYTVEAMEKPSPQQLIAAVNSRNSGEVDRLIRNGAEPKAAGLLAIAARNNDMNTMATLSRYGAKATVSDLDAARSGGVNAILALIQYGAAPRSQELMLMVENRNTNGASTVIRSGVQPDRSHAIKALQLQDRAMLEILLSRGVLLSKEDLQLAVNQNNAEIVQLVLNSGAVPDETMLIQTIKSRSDAVMMALLKNVVPGHNSLIEAAMQNNANTFRILTQNGAVLAENSPIYKAMDNNNRDIVTLGLKNGGNPTDALRYATQKNNKDHIQLCLDNRADPSAAIGYAVRVNDMNLVNALLTTYNVNPNECMQEAINNGNINAATAALNTRKVRSNGFISAAAEKNNMAIVKALTENGGNPNLAMPAAVRNKNTELTGYLLARGASARPDEYIVKAVQDNSTDILVLLVKNGADVNTGMPAAIAAKNANIIKYLLDNGASPHGYIAKPAGEGSLDIVKLLLDKGAIPDEGMPAAVNANQTAVTKTLLMAGAKAQGFIQIPAGKNNLEMVTDLLRAGANPDPGMAPAVNGNFTPIVKLLLDNGAAAKGYLNKPASIGNLEMVKLLLEKNADPNEGIQSSLTGNHTAVIKLLITKGADGNRFIATPSGFGNLEIVQLLLSKGAKAELGIKAAITNGHAPVAEALLAAGADGTKKEYMDLSVNKKYARLIPVLVKAGNKVDSTVIDAKGRTHLHNAAELDGSFELVKELLKAGASVYAKDNDGYTPLYMAVDEGKDDIETVRLLLDAGSDPCSKDNKGRTIFKEAKGSKVKKLIKEYGGSRKCS